MTDMIAPSDELLRIMKQREEREARREAREEEERRATQVQYEAKVARRKSGDEYVQNMERSIQAKCDHRKGTAGRGRKFKHIDFMINRHTFQGNITRIKCEKCHFKWFPGDTETFCANTLENFQKGIRKTPNPTKLSYNQAWQMTLEENTTNTPSRSEMVTSGPVPQTAE